MKKETNSTVCILHVGHLWEIRLCCIDVSSNPCVNDGFYRSQAIITEGLVCEVCFFWDTDLYNYTEKL